MMRKFAGLGENKRAWLGGGALVAVVLLVAGWFMVIGPQLSAGSADRDQTAAAQQHNQVLQSRNDALEEKNGDRGALQAGLSAALAQLPSDGGLPAFTRQLSAQAKAADVVLTSVIVGAPVPVAAPVGQATATGTAAPVSPAAGTTTAAAAPAGSTGLVQMMITINVTGLGRHDLAFLRAIQWTGPRRALVTDVQLAPIAGGSATGATATGAQPTGSTAAGGAAASSTTASGTTAGGAAPQSTTASGAAASSTTASGTAASSTGAGIDGPCNLTLTLTIFSAPLSPSAQADLEKLLSGK